MRWNFTRKINYNDNVTLYHSLLVIHCSVVNCSLFGKTDILLIIIRLRPHMLRKRNNQ